MPSNPRRSDPNNPPARDETPPEFAQRVQDQMDQDSWAGRDTVGAHFPEPAKIIEIDYQDNPPVIYRRKDGV